MYNIPCAKAKERGGTLMANKNGGIKIAAQNKKAYHDYFVEEKYEAGIELFGTEVKSIRAGSVNLKDSYCLTKNKTFFTIKKKNGCC